MTIGERIEERRLIVGIKSQAELARRAQMPQSTMNSLIKRPYRWSPSLPRLARELLTTVEYLVGETDDPDLNAPPPLPPAPARLLMEVTLPPERALARMFSGLLKGLDRTASVDEQALLLARRLPIGLSQLRDLAPEPMTAPAVRRAPTKDPVVPAKRDHEPTQ